jgi:predicted Zn finger-like uncharacterized protein
MDIQIHPTHRRITHTGVVLLALPAVFASVATAIGLVGAGWVLIAFGSSAALLFPWIIWRNTCCRCPRCGAWLRVDRDSGRPPGGPQLFRCNRCEVLWDDQMRRGG